MACTLDSVQGVEKLEGAIAVAAVPLAAVVPISMVTDLERTHALAHVPARPAFGM